jgi:FMN phosphatase YigB (HAD superfamily)
MRWHAKPRMFKLLSFDVYGTLIDTPPTNAKAFRAIIEEAGASDIDPLRSISSGRSAT